MIAILSLVPILYVTEMFCPNPTDTCGWAVRVRTLEFHRPYVAGESVGDGTFALMLLNRTKREREHIALEATPFTGDLEVYIQQPDGEFLPVLKVRSRGLAGLPVQKKLPAGAAASAMVAFSSYRFHRFSQAGEYRLRVSLNLAGDEVISPDVKFTVIEPAPDAILASQPIALVGYQAERAKDERGSATIQQIKIGDRTYLFYRRWSGSKHEGRSQCSFRLAELPGKCEMKVEGAYGDWGPLTITYKTSPTTEPIKRVINSVDGTPWTQEDQDSYDFSHSIAPAPRPKP